MAIRGFPDTKFAGRGSGGGYAPRISRVGMASHTMGFGGGRGSRGIGNVAQGATGAAGLAAWLMSRNGGLDNVLSNMSMPDVSLPTILNNPAETRRPNIVSTPVENNRIGILSTPVAERSAPILANPAKRREGTVLTNPAKQQETSILQMRVGKDNFRQAGLGDSPSKVDVIDLLDRAEKGDPDAMIAADRLTGRIGKDGRIREWYTDINRDYVKRRNAYNLGEKETNKNKIWKEMDAFARQKAVNEAFRGESRPLEREDMYTAMRQLIEDLPDDTWMDDLTNTRWSWGHRIPVAEQGPHGIEHGGWESISKNAAEGSKIKPTFSITR